MNNCLTYALRTWRFGRASDHLVIRKSHWGWFPHFAVIFELADGSLVKKEYVPIKPRPRWIPPLFFRGVEKTTVYSRQEVPMPDKVTDLAAWKAAHPPAIRTANAMIRCWWKWASLAFWWPFLR